MNILPHFSGRVLFNTVRRQPTFLSSFVTIFSRNHNSGQVKISESRQTIARQKIKQIEALNDPLTDRFYRRHTYLRISLTEKCNFRCKYCMPPEGVELTPKSHLLSNDEIITLAKIFAKRGVNKIRLTGGEPTLRKDLDYLIAQLKAIPGIEEIGITTNGLILKRILPKLKEAGLDKINISLDSLIPAKFEKMTRIFGFEKVMASIKAAEDLMGRIKINVVVMRGYNVNEIVDFVELTKKRNLDIRFIEFMPFGGNEFSKSTFVSYAEQLALIREKFGDALVRLPDGENDTSKAYKIEGHIGQFGFISSMSENFCSTCNRIRLTANGNLKVCLHSNAETSLLKVLRAGGTEEDIEKTIREALQGKHRQHAGLDNLLHLENRPMVLIGG